MAGIRAYSNHSQSHSRRLPLPRAIASSFMLAFALSGCTDPDAPSNTIAATSTNPSNTANEMGADSASSASANAAELIEAAASPLATITVPELVQQLANGEVTAVDLTQGYLDRIAQLDQSGPSLRAMISINPDAVVQAKASDARRARGESLGPLDGIPVVVKDNIETADPMPTTAGSLALKDNITGRDSPAVAGLRASGAVILGKTNLSQWANFRSNDSISGWSSVGGQVQNPHVLDRSPCGSSSGSGAAVAAGLAPLAIGTETNGSIICPANVNGVVGFKPTLGLLSQTGIVPISPSQDTAGPMARSVRGAALMLDSMAGTGDKFTAALDSAEDLSTLTIGVLRFSQGDNAAIIDRFNKALTLLEQAGATLVEIDSFESADPELRPHETILLETEFKASLNAYLGTTPESVEVKSLAQLIEFNTANAKRELALFDQSIFVSSEARPDLSDADYRAALAAVKHATGTAGIDRLLRESGADVLVAPSGPLAPPRDPVNGDNWPSWVGAGYMAAMAGYPHLSIPMGTVKSVPLGLSVIGTAGDDARVLAVGHQWQQLYGPVPVPRYLPSANDEANIKTANMPAIPPSLN